MTRKGILILLLFTAVTAHGQLNTEELSLTISKAEEANLQKLKAYLWKRKSEAYIDGQLKATIITDFSFDVNGKIQAKVIDAQTSVKQKLAFGVMPRRMLLMPRWIMSKKRCRFLFNMPI